MKTLIAFASRSRRGHSWAWKLGDLEAQKLGGYVSLMENVCELPDTFQKSCRKLCADTSKRHLLSTGAFKDVISLGDHLGHLWCQFQGFRRSWDPLGASWAPLGKAFGAPWGDLEVSGGGGLGASWAGLGASWRTMLTHFDFL